jgi:hypothetical protein
MYPQAIDLDQGRLLVDHAHEYSTRLSRDLQFCLGSNSELVPQALGKDDSPGFVDLQLRGNSLCHLPLTMVAHVVLVNPFRREKRDKPFTFVFLSVSRADRLIMPFPNT